MKGRTNCGISTSINNYIPIYAKLKISAPINSTVSVSHIQIIKILDSSNIIETFDNYVVYLLNIAPSDFGDWTISCIKNDITKSENIIIDTTTDYSIYVGFNTPPDIYQDLEYIEATGTQYINSLVLGTNGAECTFEYIFNVKNDASSIFGARNNWGSGRFGMGEYANRFWWLPEVSTPSSYFPTSDTNKHHTKHGYITNWGIYLDDNLLTITGADRTTSIYTRIFCEYVSEGSTGVTNYSRSRIYNLTLYIDSRKMREMYPCYRKSDLVAGLYDKLNNKFLINSGTGKFIMGPRLNSNINSIYLYKDGDENVDITGGFEGKNNDTRYQASGASITKNEDNIFISNVANASMSAVTINKIDVSNYNTIEVIGYKATDAADNVAIGLSSTGLPDSNGSHTLARAQAASYFSANSIAPTKFSLDISSIQGEQYIYVQGLINGGFYIKSIRLF